MMTHFDGYSTVKLRYRTSSWMDEHVSSSLWSSAAVYTSPLCDLFFINFPLPLPLLKKIFLIQFSLSLSLRPPLPAVSFPSPSFILGPSSFLLHSCVKNPKGEVTGAGTLYNRNPAMNSFVTLPVIQ